MRILVLFFFIQFLSSAQKLTLIDTLSRKPIPNAKCFNFANKMIGISNLNGEILFNNQLLKSIRISHDLYKDFTFKYTKSIDTIWLFPSASFIEEVVVKGMSNEQFVETLIVNSSRKLIDSKRIQFDATYNNNRYIIHFQKDTLILSGTIKGKVTSKINKKNTSRFMVGSVDSSFRTANYKSFPQIKPTRVDSIFYPILSEESLFKFDIGNPSNFKFSKNTTFKRWKENDYGKLLVTFSNNSKESYRTEFVYSLKDTLILSMSSVYTMNDGFYELKSANYSLKNGEYFLETMTQENYQNFDLNNKNTVQYYNCQSILLEPSSTTSPVNEASFIQVLNQTKCRDGVQFGLSQPVYRNLKNISF